MKLLVGKRIVATMLILTVFFSTIMAFTSYNLRNTVVTAATTDSAFETQIAGFPESYKSYLRVLHTEHPNWKFEAYNTGISWNEMFIKGENEMTYSRNLIPHPELSKIYIPGAIFKVPTSWISDDAYNIDGIFKGESGGDWVQGSQEIVEYMMDPRNFLNDTSIFQFEKLNYDQEYHTYNLMKSILEDSFMDCDYATVSGTNGLDYATVFIEAAKATKINGYIGISPLYLASLVIQEKGRGIKQSDGRYKINDVLGSGNILNGVKYYNFYNIGATGKTTQDVINNGTNEAKTEGWTSQYQAIVNGAVKIYNKYFKLGQNTLYFHKYNVLTTERYFKQYQQNIFAAYNEGYRMGNTCYANNIYEKEYLFLIPVFYNMPEEATNFGHISMPITASTYLLKSLSVSTGNTNLSLSQTFDSNINTYSTTVENNVTSVSVNYTKNVGNKTVYVSGNTNLSVGINKIQVKIADTGGNYWSYFIYVNRLSANYLSDIKISDGILSPSFDKTTEQYSTNVKNSTNKIVVKVTPTMNAWVTMEYNGKKYADITEINNADLQVGKNVFYIYVTSANGGLRTYTVTVNRAAATPTPTEPENTPPKLTCSSSKYKIASSGTTSYINGFTVGTDVKTTLANLTVYNGTAKIVNSAGKAKASTDAIATGDRIVLTGTTSGTETLNAIVYGDINGDGKINLVDYAYMKASYWDKKTLTGIKALAGNIYNKTNGVDLFDLAYMKKYIWDSGTITQYR